MLQLALAHRDPAPAFARDSGRAYAPAPIRSGSDAPGFGDGALLGALLDRLDQGLAITDGSAQVHFLNRAARRLVEHGHLAVRHDRLRAESPRDTAALHRIIARCADGTARAASARFEDGEAGILALATAARTGAQGPEPGLAVVMLVDPASGQRANVALLREQFDLTRAEAALAAEIVQGDGLGACAERLGIKLSTARTHLQRVFEKTGTSRQAELVRLLLLCRFDTGEG